LICAIYGIEYAVNYAGPEIDGYKKWLKTNNLTSYLEMTKAE